MAKANSEATRKSTRRASQKAATLTPKTINETFKAGAKTWYRLEAGFKAQRTITDKSLRLRLK